MSTAKQESFDEYRVTLFKRKLRDLLPEIGGLRFERSKGRCHLIIPVRWSYYNNADKVFKLILDRFKSLGIEAEAKAMFSWIGDGRPDYITIPIDQEALPERLRTTKRTKK